MRWLTDEAGTQIGGEQPLSAAAVERHISSIFAKLGHNEPPNTDCQWPPCSTAKAPRLVEMLTARLNPVLAGGLRPVQPPRLLHGYRVRQPSFRTINRYEMRAVAIRKAFLGGTLQPVALRDATWRRRTSGAKLVIDISARRSRLLGLDSNQQADGGCFWRRQPLLTWQLPPC